jgi:hypothetical protein
MSTFNIDFFELAFLAEACIPPRPIARAMFWQNLTKQYWYHMSEGERAHLFEWMNRNDWYKESLQKETDTKIFHARFDPDNQYIVKTKHKKKEEEHRAFKRYGSEEEGFTNRYYVGHDTYIPEEYITSVTKFTPKREY